MKRIPIAAAKRIAKDYSASIVVIFAHARDGSQHVTTYGVNVEESREAAHAGNRVRNAAGWPKELCQATTARARKQDAERDFAELDLAGFLAWAEHNARMGPGGLDYEHAAYEWRKMPPEKRAMFRGDAETARRALRAKTGGK